VFFFQAEDGIRDRNVTGVQTCALPISGEFVSLTREEKFELMEVAVDQVDGRVPLVAGTAAETTKDAIMYTQHAERVGADGSLLKIGRASCRERVYIEGGRVYVNRKMTE